MTKPSRGGLPHLIDALRFSIKGLKSAWHTETAFRQQVSLLPFLIFAAIWLGQTMIEQLLLISSLLLIIIIELVNSAIESAVDRIGTEMHPLSGQAKDLGSAAVFMAMLLALFIWTLIAIYRFLL